MVQAGDSCVSVTCDGCTNSVLSFVLVWLFGRKTATKKYPPAKIDAECIEHRHSFLGEEREINCEQDINRISPVTCINLDKMKCPQQTVKGKKSSGVCFTSCVCSLSLPLPLAFSFFQSKSILKYFSSLLCHPPKYY